jgi:polysaccharide deacetylase family protein (PEP-CTERM system associated)
VDVGEGHASSGIDLPPASHGPEGYFTVDVEDWFQSLEEDPRLWDGFEDRIVGPTTRLVELLRNSGSTATFFVLGYTAERHPELVQSILGAGHEIGTHGHFHRPIHDLGPNAFRQDLRRSLRALREAGATDVVSFRAPYFSLPRAASWARTVLADEGIMIDSSVFPLRNGSYGMQRAANFPSRWGPLWEFPLTLPTYARLRLPLSGGFYSRFFPLSWTLGGIGRVRASGHRPLFYVHPWELDPDQPRHSGPRFRTARHYHRIRHGEGIVTKVLAECRWGTLRAGLDSLLSRRPVQMPTEPVATRTHGA